MGVQSNWTISEANRRNPDMTPPQQVRLSELGSGGNVSIARAAALEHEGALRSLIDGAEVVILVCGVGGGTGSGVAPILAKMAQEADALTLGVVVTPFRWELGRYPNAFQAVKQLERECHYLASLSNSVVGDLLGEQATLDDLITQQELLGTACIHRLMVDGSRFCIDDKGRSG
jgi:cell division GTPase FtsZ